MSRLTPLQHDWESMIRAMEIELQRIGAADEALTRRIVLPDNNRADKERVHTSGTTDPTGGTTMARIEAQLNREAYRDSMLTIWAAIKAHRFKTTAVLRGEPVEAQSGLTCISRDCDNFASPHTRPDTGDVLADLCDDCWRNLCTKCYLRAKDRYRDSCDACRKREERQVA